MIQQFRKHYLYYIPFLALILFMMLIRIKLLFSYSFDNAGLEHYFIHVVQRILMQQPIYPNPLELPNENCLYTPFYPYLLTIIYKIYKINPTFNLYKMYALGRFISLILVFVQLHYLTKLLQYFISSRLIKLIIITIFLLLLTGHIYSIRPDAMKLLFFTLFIYQLIGYFFFDGTKRNWYLALLFAVIAVYSKQDITIHIFISLFVLFITSAKKKQVLLFSLLFSITCFLVFAFFSMRYGQYVFTNLVLLNLQSVSEITKSYNIYFIIFSIIRTLPLLVLIFLNFKTIKRDFGFKNINAFIVLCSLLFYVYAHLSILRAAANLNYTYELLLFLMLNTSVYYSLHKKKITQKNRLYAVILGIYILFLFFSNFLTQCYSFHTDKEQQFKEEYFALAEESKTIKQLIGNGSIFLPNSKYMVLFADANMIGGHDMHIDRFIILYTDIDIFIKSKLSSINTKSYDDNFLNGTVQYLLIPDDKKSIAHVQKYYPAYRKLFKTKHLILYKFGTTDLP